MDSLTESLLLDRRRAGRPESASRRTRVRLRDLCDEVLASYRAAKGQHSLSDAEREDARAMLSQVAPGAVQPRR